jgi:hypothetical protein
MSSRIDLRMRSPDARDRFRARFPRRILGTPPRIRGPGSRPRTKSARGWSAERRDHQPLALQTCLRRLRRPVCDEPRLTLIGAPPSGAPPAAFLSPAPCFRSGRGCALRAPLAGRLPPPLASRHVQPFKAAGPSAGGRLAGASRSCGYKPQQRAPPPPHVRQCPAERPKRGVVGNRTICLRNKVKTILPNMQNIWPTTSNCRIVLLKFRESGRGARWS